MRESRIKESIDESKKMEIKLRSKSFASSSRSTPFQSSYTRPYILGKYEKVIFIISIKHSYPTKFL